jgi:hypothetical protein
MTPSLRSLRRCFEGAVPAAIATCAADGMPNVAKLSHVHFIDDAHVALSYQFFNKTRDNILHNGRATLEVLDPVSAAQYTLWLEYLRTETEGPMFENMKARLAAIASHTGMSKVFRLLGSDVYRVLRIEAAPGDPEPDTSPRAELLSGLRASVGELVSCTDLAHLLDVALTGLDRHWQIRHTMLLMLDPDGRRLYQGVEKHTVTPAKAGVQCDVVNKINGLWIPACAGMTDFLRFFTFFNTLLHRRQPRLYGIRRGLRGAPGRRHRRRRRQRPHTDPHRLRGAGISLQPGHPPGFRRQRQWRGAGNRDSVSRTCGSRQPVGGAAAAGGKSAGRAVCGKSAGAALHLRR